MNKQAPCVGCPLLSTCEREKVVCSAKMRYDVELLFDSSEIKEGNP